MKKEDVFAKAYNSYKKLIEVCDDLYNYIIVKYYPDVSKKMLLAQLDIYIQAILLGVAASDKKIDSEELVFIDQLTDYGNVFKTIDGGYKTFIQAKEKDLEKLKEIAIDSSKNVPIILEVVAKLDTKIKEINYTEIVLRHMFEVFSCLMYIDLDYTSTEAKFSMELLSPLIKLFPEEEIKKLKKK